MRGLINAWKRSGTVRDLTRHALTILPFALAVAWTSINLLRDDAGTVLHLGFWGPARNATVLNLLLQLGPILLLPAVGLWPRWTDTLAPFRPATTGVAIALLLMHLVTVTVDQSWVAFRGGKIFLAVAPALAARGFADVWKHGHRRTTALLGLAVLTAGLPTTVILCTATVAPERTNGDEPVAQAALLALRLASRRVATFW